MLKKKDRLIPAGCVLAGVLAVVIGYVANSTTDGGANIGAGMLVLLGIALIIGGGVALVLVALPESRRGRGGNGRFVAALIGFCLSAALLVMALPPFFDDAVDGSIPALAVFGLLTIVLGLLVRRWRPAAR